MTYDKFAVHASEAKIDGPNLLLIAQPWLLRSGFIEVDDDRTTVVCNIVDYDAILKATYKLFEYLNPTPEERTVLVLLEMASQMPTNKSSAYQQLAGTKDKVVEVALDLAAGYNVVRVAESDGVAEPMLYSPTIWGDNIAKASKALSHMDATDRAVLFELLNRVTKYQRMPEVAALNWLKTQNKPKLCEFAVSIGLLDRTEILTRESTRQAFLTTPHLYGEIAAKHGRTCATAFGCSSTASGTANTTATGSLGRSGTRPFCSAAC